MILVIGIILLFRNMIARKTSEDLTEKYSGKKWASPLEGRAKYPDVDVFAFSGPLFNFGLAEVKVGELLVEELVSRKKLEVIKHLRGLPEVESFSSY